MNANMSTPPDIPSILGESLKMLRKRNGLSQLELSAKTGLSHTFINNIENGKKWVSSETLAILCEALHARPGEFFTEIGAESEERAPDYRIRDSHARMLLELDEFVARYKKDLN